MLPDRRVWIPDTPLGLALTVGALGWVLWVNSMADSTMMRAQFADEDRVIHCAAHYQRDTGPLDFVFGKRVRDPAQLDFSCRSIPGDPEAHHDTRKEGRLGFTDAVITQERRDSGCARLEAGGTRREACVNDA